MQPTPLFWLGRQPILDAAGHTVAYELLFRTAPGDGSHAEGSSATAAVIAHAFNDLGTASVLGQHQGFINFDTELLMSEVVELLPPQATVIELLETIEMNHGVIERCRALRARGFSFALDDVTHPDQVDERMLPLVDVVKVDVLAAPPQVLQRLVARLRNIPRIRLLAEKVEDHAQAQACRRLGFHLFQGYFFARPIILTGRRADPSRRLLVDLLHQCMTDESNSRIEATFKQAPELSYKLMRLVNSVGVGIGVPIQSLSHALVVIGRRQLQRWLQVLLYACHGNASLSSPLLQLAAARGKLLELMAGRRAGNAAAAADRAFMTGILSLLDTLLETPMERAIADMRLPDDIRAALLHRAGDLGRMLEVAEALERADDRRVTQLLADGYPCTTAELAQVQVAALSWSNAIGRPPADGPAAPRSRPQGRGASGTAPVG